MVKNATKRTVIHYFRYTVIFTSTFLACYKKTWTENYSLFSLPFNSFNRLTLALFSRAALTITSCFKYTPNNRLKKTPHQYSSSSRKKIVRRPINSPSHRFAAINDNIYLLNDHRFVRLNPSFYFESISLIEPPFDFNVELLIFAHVGKTRLRNKSSIFLIHTHFICICGIGWQCLSISGDNAGNRCQSCQWKSWWRHDLGRLMADGLVVNCGQGRVQSLHYQIRVLSHSGWVVTW